jgi:hypothetical protein
MDFYEAGSVVYCIERRIKSINYVSQKHFLYAYVIFYRLS